MTALAIIGGIVVGTCLAVWSLIALGYLSVTIDVDKDDDP